MQIMPQTVRDQYELVESLKAESEPKWGMDASQKRGHSKELAAGTEERSGNAQKRLGRTRLNASPDTLPTSAWGGVGPMPQLPVPVPAVASDTAAPLSVG